jgi:16S rRNA (guanine(527)-N(7))-methyltransferase RsmG
MKNPEFGCWSLHADIQNPLWQAFALQEQLTAEQLLRFQQYFGLLVAWNQYINITRIITLSDVLAYHFSDSLRFGDCVDATKKITLVDVGTGGGFPGVPLRIKYPQMHITLLEVTQKRVLFLQEIIKVLGITNITIDTRDWRTYLHHASSIDYVCARASLQVPELMRVYNAGRLFQNTQVVYWASAQWELPSEYDSCLVRDYTYHVGEKKRRLIFLTHPNFHKG